MPRETRRPPEAPKAYDAAYFRRWYGAPRDRASHAVLVRRRAAVAVAAAEHLLERPVRNALDVGCGEAPWRTALLRLRPRLRYAGVEPSAWAVGRHARGGDVLHGALGDLERLPLRGPYDLVVCSDVLHYVSDGELRAGLRAMAGLCRGLLWLEAFTAEDDFEGDVQGFRPRAARWYRAAFRRAGLVPLGLWLHASPAIAHRVAALERAG